MVLSLSLSLFLSLSLSIYLSLPSTYPSICVHACVSEAVAPRGLLGRVEVSKTRLLAAGQVNPGFEKERPSNRPIACDSPVTSSIADQFTYPRIRSCDLSHQMPRTNCRHRFCRGYRRGDERKRQIEQDRER